MKTTVRLCRADGTHLGVGVAVDDKDVEPSGVLRDASLRGVDKIQLPLSCRGKMFSDRKLARSRRWVWWPNSNGARWSSNWRF